MNTVSDFSSFYLFFNVNANINEAHVNVLSVILYIFSLIGTL